MELDLLYNVTRFTPFRMKICILYVNPVNNEPSPMVAPDVFKFIEEVWD